MSLLRRIRDKLLRMKAYRPTLFSASEWDGQFQSGRWDYLESVDELAHHSIIAGYFTKIGPERSLLDVGCGTGVLGSLLPAGTRYVGIDISTSAISRAKLAGATGSNFLVANAENYVPDEKFGMIVFNESLYYFQEPLDTMQRMADALEQSGKMVVSMYADANTAHLWRMIEVYFATLDEVVVQNIRGTRWRIRLITPKDRI
jgi:SAM-dependent methyltransferase